VEGLSGLAGLNGLVGRMRVLFPVFAAVVCVFDGLAFAGTRLFTGEILVSGFALASGFLERESAEGVFFGDGDGGRIFGSFSRNDLIGVEGLGVFEGLGLLRWRGLVVVMRAGEVSSGRLARFNLLRTSYKSQNDLNNNNLNN
jgi:hypothetical protein